LPLAVQSDEPARRTTARRSNAVAARVLDEQSPKLRVIEDGVRDVRESLESSREVVEKNAASR
jgi:hypothetical protein